MITFVYSMLSLLGQFVVPLVTIGMFVLQILTFVEMRKQHQK